MSVAPEFTGAGGRAAGRTGRVASAVLSAAFELAPLARRLATRIANGSGDLSAFMEVHRKDVVRVLALAASIEGTVVGGLEIKAVARAYLQDLVKGGFYVTHYLGRDEQWCCVDWVSVPGSTTVMADRDGRVVPCDAADLGLCPYGGETGAWHPNVWTERTDGNIADGKTLAGMVDNEADGIEVELEDE